MSERLHSFEDNLMPRSTIRNCAKAVLKQDAPIQKEALLALTKGSTVFISYLTAQANDIAVSRKRKTIMPSDVFEALKAIEFERFVPELQREHAVADAAQKEKRNKKKPTDAATQQIAAAEEDTSEGSGAKRQRMEENSISQTDARDSDGEGDREDEEDETMEDGESDDDDDDDELDETADIDAVHVHANVDAAQTDPDVATESFADSREAEYDEALDNGDESD